MGRPGAKLIGAGLVLAVIGFGLIQIGIRKGTCTDCEDDAEATITDIAQASAELNGDEGNEQ